jgi:hypothetical protein
MDSISSASGYYKFDIFMAWIFRELADGCHLTKVSAFLPFLQSYRRWNMYMGHAVYQFTWIRWFWRLWVVQKAALAPAGLVYFGSVSMPLDLMISAASNYHFHLRTGCWPVLGVDQDTFDGMVATI